MAQAHAALELIEESTFTIRVADRTIAGLSVESRWEGLTKFKRAATGESLIMLMAERRVISGSPDLLHWLGLIADEHFVTVPTTTLPDGRVVPSFQYARYPASKGADGRLVLDPAAKPWVSITYHNAAAACDAAGYELARETQELAVRHLVCQVDANWTGGKVGHGTIYQGLHRGTVGSAQAADYVAGEDERSWHVLPNGERIYGLAGNIYTYVHDDVQGDERGLVAGRLNADSPSLMTAPHQSKQKGMGYRPDGDRGWSGLALVRGGCWHGGDDAGVFALLYAYPDNAGDDVGFRYTKPSTGL